MFVCYASIIRILFIFGMGDRSRVWATTLVFNQRHPGLLRLPIPLWVGAMSTADGLSHS